MSPPLSFKHQNDKRKQEGIRCRRTRRREEEGEEEEKKEVELLIYVITENNRRDIWKREGADTGWRDTLLRILTSLEYYN